jgi:hypothetical protein
MLIGVVMTEFDKNVIKAQLRDRSEREHLKFRESMKRVFGPDIFSNESDHAEKDKVYKNN